MSATTFTIIVTVVFGLEVFCALINVANGDQPSKPWERAASRISSAAIFAYGIAVLAVEGVLK